MHGEAEVWGFVLYPVQPDNRLDNSMTAMEKDKNGQSEAARLYEGSSKKNRNLFLFYLVIIAYILIIVASTTDLELLLPESLITLPVLSVGIPLTYFYVLSSPLVLILHFNLLHSTTEHRKKIKQWEKEESINLLHSTIEHQKKIKQWKKEEIISSHLMNPYIFDFAYLSPSGRWGNILVYSTSFLLYFLAPICLFCIQLRFSDYQSLWYSFEHVICLWIDLYFLILFFNGDHNSSRKKQDSVNSNSVVAFLKFFKYKYISELLKKFSIHLMKGIGKLFKEDGKNFLMITLIFFVGAFYFGIVGMLRFDTTIEWLEKSRERIPRITIPQGTKIQKQSLEELKLIAIQIGTSETNAWVSHGENYDLSGRRLVFSDLSGNYMQKIVLKEAHLQGSKMFMTQLQGAYMDKAQLQGADMFGAQLQGADMLGAQLQGANMIGAQLQGADMLGAQLQGAYMKGAQLQGAYMKKSQLQGAYMEEAQLQGAYMEEAQLQGAYMKGAQLQGAYMEEAQLQGAYMKGAQLQGAYMKEAQLQGAYMEEVELQGAYMLGVKLSGTDMEKANLRGSFCKEKKYDSFFDQMNARIGKRGLKGCKTMDDSQFGVLSQETANSIIQNLRSNRNASKKITDKIKKNINNRVGEAPSMVEVEKGVLKLKETCSIIAGWLENLEYAPGLKKTFVGWLDTKAGKKSKLKKCSMPI